MLAANNGAKIDRIIDVEFGENIIVNAEVIAARGTIATNGSAKNIRPTKLFGPLPFSAVTIDIALMYNLTVSERRRAIERLYNALIEGALSCPAADIFPLSDTALAHEAVESGHREGAILENPRRYCSLVTALK